MSSSTYSYFLSLFALSVATFIIRGTKKGRLSIRFALGWLALSFLIFTGAFAVNLVQPVATFFSVSVSTLFAVAILFLFTIISVQFSISLSGLALRSEKIAEEHGLRNVRRSPIENQLDGNVLAVVPAFNEEHNLQEVVSGLMSLGFPVLVVDDGSHDRTAQIATDEGASVIQLPYNLGVGAAIRCGLMFATQNGYDFVVQCDADGQHPISTIPLLIEHQVRTNCDLVIGSRFTLGAPEAMEIPLGRRLVMRALAKITTRATGNRITDSTSGFRLISQPLMAELAVNMPSYYLGDTFEAYVAAGRAGYDIQEIPAVIRERSSGVSSSSFTQSLLMISKAVLLTTARLGIRLPQRPSTER